MEEPRHLHEARIRDSAATSIGRRSTYHRLNSLEGEITAIELGEREDTLPSTSQKGSISTYTPSHRSGHSSLHSDLDPFLVSYPKHLSHVSRKKGSKWYAWSRGRAQQGWRLGILLGCFASALVLTVNVVLLLTGAFRYGGYRDGIGTLAQGRSDSISRLSTAYHILINVLSTSLLTASNYCMQLLCSPAREEVDSAHRQAKWLHIGILSPSNLRLISPRKALLWWVLALSSIPLHFLYNSTVFEVKIGQNYSVTFIGSNETSKIQDLSTVTVNLTNEEWKSIYDTQLVPNYGDLFLVVDEVAFSIALNETQQDWTLLIDTPNTDNWTRWDGNESIPITASVLLNNDGSYEVTNLTSYRAVYSLSGSYGTTWPSIQWPQSAFVNASEMHSIHDLDALSSLARDDWLTTTPIHVAYGLAKPIRNSSSIQTSLIFLLVVVLANTTKLAIMILVYKWYSTSFLITTGDAIASFLEKPDVVTAGLCIVDKSKIVDHLHGKSDGKSAFWTSRHLHWLSAVSNTERIPFLIVFFIAGSVTVLGLTEALPNSLPKQGLLRWGTASEQQLSFARKAFDTRSILANSLLANAPQVLLSLSYFSFNRLATSLIVAREWNAYGLMRKGLRVTNPSGAQRNTYFLNLPFRYAIPLTVTSGFLHWLLSQSIFLARFEVRDEQGHVIPAQSTSTCAYSPLSILVFGIIWLLLSATLAVLPMLKMEVNMPLAANSSLVISAACHPPPDDTDAQLKPVQWGVVRSRFGGDIAHCTFSSEDVTLPEDGKPYA